MNKFEEKYFAQSEYSNYEDYRMKKFEKLAADLMRILALDPDNRILDFGCATGGLLKSFKDRGYYNIKGTDISHWAIEYGKTRYGLDEELEYHNVNLLTEEFDVILFIDVLEHIPSVTEIQRYLQLVRKGTRVVIRLPISRKEGEPYVFEVSRNDTTHVQCHSAGWWNGLIERCGYVSSLSFDGRAIYESRGVFARTYMKG